MFVPVTAEQVPALRRAGLLWYKHPWIPEFRRAKEWLYSDEEPLSHYQWNVDRGTVYAILLED